MNLVLLRHGKSMANSNVPVNNEDENLLTSEGLGELIANAITFKENNPNYYFDAVVCSSMPRAVQTCYTWLSSMDHPSVPVTITNLLVERDFGTDNKFLNAQQVDALYGTGHMDAWFNDLDCVPCGKGETVKALYGRVKQAYDTLITPLTYDGKNVLVVSHYATLGAMASHIETASHTNALRYRFTNSTPRKYSV